MQGKFVLYFLAVPFAGVFYLLSRNQGVWLAILLTFLSARSGQTSMIFTLAL